MLPSWHAMARPVLLWTLAPVVAPKRPAFQVPCSAGHGSAWPLLCIPMFRQIWLSEVTAMLSLCHNMSQNVTVICQSLCHYMLWLLIPRSRLNCTVNSSHTTQSYAFGLACHLPLYCSCGMRRKITRTILPDFHRLSKIPFANRHAKVFQGHNSTPWRSWSSSQIRSSPRLVVFCPPSSHSGSGDTTTPATPEPGMISNRLCEQSAIQQLKD